MKDALGNKIAIGDVLLHVSKTTKVVKVTKLVLRLKYDGTEHVSMTVRSKGVNIDYSSYPYKRTPSNYYNGAAVGIQNGSRYINLTALDLVEKFDPSPSA